MRYKKAPKWKFFLAKVFGKRQVYFDNDFIITSYFFRGSVYITKIQAV